MSATSMTARRSAFVGEDGGACGQNVPMSLRVSAVFGLANVRIRTFVAEHSLCCENPERLEPVERVLISRPPLETRAACMLWTAFEEV